MCLPLLLLIIMRVVNIGAFLEAIIASATFQALYSEVTIFRADVMDCSLRFTGSPLSSFSNSWINGVCFSWAVVPFSISYTIFSTRTSFWDGSSSWSLSTPSQTISVWETLHWIQISHLDSQQLPCCLCTLVLCWSFCSAKSVGGILLWMYLREDLLLVFMSFASCSFLANLPCVFYIEPVRIYYPFYFLHLDMISASWMMLLLVTALQPCWLAFIWVFISSLHLFFRRCSFAACSLLIKPWSAFGFFSWISILQVINGHCAACMTGVMIWKQTFNFLCFFSSCPL